MTEIEGLEDGVDVHRVVQRLAHLDVVEGRLAHVDRHVEDARRGDRLDHELVVLLQLGDAHVGDRRDQVDLAGLESGDPRGVLENRPHDDRLHLRRAAPVILIRLEHQPLVLRPRDQLERAGPVRLDGDRFLARGVGVFRREHQPEQLAQAHRQEEVGRPGGDVHGEGVHDLGAGDRAELGADGGLRFGIRGSVEGELDRVGVEVVAVVELDAFAQRELPGGRVQPFPGLGEGGHQVALDVAGRQAVVDVGDEDLGIAPDGQVRVEGVRLGREADLGLAGRRGGDGSARVEPCRRGGQAQNAERVAPGHRSRVLGSRILAGHERSFRRLRRRSAGP